MNLFRLDASIFTDGSRSRALADLAEAEVKAALPDVTVTRRHVGTDPIPATAWAAAVTAGFTPDDQRSAEQNEAVALAAQLADEIVNADAIVFAVPLYNFGVSQHFKTYIDLAITDPRLASGVEAPLAGKPVILATVRGGAYGEGTPRAGWDHATAWMRRILEDVWGADVKVVEQEFTLVGVNPALDDFKELGAQFREEAERTAAEHGRTLARQLAPAAV
ncbi:MAG: NAD(P)H-dependent oxidoreductase [Solirubrobacteraceae bacterium]|nr:NAD(P)H-dependent oxidoreductase [Solirubrobacteraceae bacterium]